MKVFSDFHHGSLYYSLQLLFEKRLGWELYRPIGIDWYFQKYWAIADPYPNPTTTANQYLGTGHEKYDKYRQLNADYHMEDDVYMVYDPDNYTHQRAITLQKFKEMDIDIVIASYLGNIEPFRRLIDQYKPNAKLIHQMGNNWINSVDFDLVKNLMASTSKIALPPGINTVFYHQEFDLEEFKPPTHNHYNKIVCLMNNLQAYPDAGAFFEMEREMPDWDFKSYGASNRDDSLAGYINIADVIKHSTFVWHLKLGGDGYGHVLHNAFACGKPPIVKREYYKGQLADKLMKDGKTCIFADGLPLQTLIKKVRYYADPVQYDKMSENAYRAFKDNVDFDREFEDLKKFLDVLV